jgi:hypothetical protein
MTINARVLREYFTKEDAFAKKKTLILMATGGVRHALLNFNIFLIAKTLLALHIPTIMEKNVSNAITHAKNAMDQKRRIA